MNPFSPDDPKCKGSLVKLSNRWPAG